MNTPIRSFRPVAASAIAAILITSFSAPLHAAAGPVDRFSKSNVARAHTPDAAKQTGREALRPSPEALEAVESLRRDADGDVAATWSDRP